MTAAAVAMPEVPGIVQVSFRPGVVRFVLQRDARDADERLSPDEARHMASAFTGEFGWLGDALRGAADAAEEADSGGAR